MYILLLSTISLYLVAFNTHSASASYYNQNHNYDPEQQDGIPVFSARSIAKMDDDWTNSMQESIRPRAAQRRQTDNDLDDGLEEDDDDEYRSGSSPHESVASPSYGESQRFARDGDEIEDFFDKHLGPPKETDSVDESADQPTIIQQESTMPAIDPDDHYEAAASGPLSSIFQSLLGHSKDTKNSKRPFLQITTSSSSDSDTAMTKDEPKAASTANSLKASQSAQSFVEASPVALAIAPVAASSIQESSSSSEQEPSSGIDSGVREIYIGRRPTVMSYLQQQQQQQKPLQHLSGYTTAGSANIWRGPNGQPVVYEQEQANDYSRYPVAASYAYQQQPSNSAQASEPAAGGTGDDDEQTVTYGLSFGGGSDSSAPANEPAQDQEAADPAGSGQVESHPIDQQQQQPRGYVPYNTRYTTSSSRALNNYYSNYYRQPPAGYVRAYPVQQQQQMFRQQQMMPMHYQPYHQQPQQQHYTSNAPTRYHRDPSESSAQSAAMRVSPVVLRGANYDPANYDGMIQQQQHRGNQAGAKVNRDQVKERQRLLASLDREIKASPQYRSNHATTSDASAQRSSYLRRPPPFDGQRQLVTYKEVKNNYLGDDLDSYNSYHSETDPFKTQTTTSRMVNDPLAFLTRGRQQSNSQEQVDFRQNHDPASTTNHVANQALEMNYNSGKGSYQQVIGQTGQMDNNASNGASMQQNQQKSANSNLLTGPLMNYVNSNNQVSGHEDLLRNKNQEALNIANGGSDNKGDTNRVSGHSRVRRDDSDEREIDNDADDDGVWVDDDDDDDNRQQSSDVNETSQQPEEEEDEEDGQQDDATNNVLTPTQLNPPGVIGGPHGYELSPNDLMIYHG